MMSYSSSRLASRSTKGSSCPKRWWIRKASSRGVNLPASVRAASARAEASIPARMRPNSVEISVVGWQVMSRQPVRIVQIRGNLHRQPGEARTTPPGKACVSLAPGVLQGSSPSGIFIVVPRHVAPPVALLRVGRSLSGFKGPAPLPAVVFVALVAHPEIWHAGESVTADFVPVVPSRRSPEQAPVPLSCQSWWGLRGHRSPQGTPRRIYPRQ